MTSNNGKYGIICNEAFTPKIEDNRIENNKEFGIYISNKSHPLIDKNIISNNNQYGIYVIDRSWPTIENNEINNHEIGIYIDSTSNATVRNNIFNNNDKDIIDKYHEKDENGNKNPLLMIENQIVIILVFGIIISAIWVYWKKKQKKPKS